MRARLTAAAIAAALVLGAGAPAAEAAGGAPGTPDSVQFSTAKGDAPQLQPGMYLTARPTGTTTHYAKIHRPKDGSVAVAIFGNVDAAITTLDGDDCSDSLGSGIGDYTFVSVDGANTERQDYQPDDCASATDLLLTLQAKSLTSSSDKTPAPTEPLELAVTVEPRLVHAGAPATESQLTKITAPSTSTSGANLALSTRRATPTTLTPKSYPVSLSPDTNYFVRVRVGWGQRLAAAVDAPRNGTNRAPGADVRLLIGVFSPQWAPVGTTSAALLFKNDAQERSSTAYTAAVSAANRNLTYDDTGDADTSASQWTTVAGWYYVAVRLAPYGDGPAPKTPLPARLDLEVVGAATSGPTYAGAGGSAVAAPPATELSRGGSNGSGSSTTTLLRLGGTALVLVIAGAAIAILLRRRA